MACVSHYLCPGSVVGWLTKPDSYLLFVFLDGVQFRAVVPKLEARHHKGSLRDHRGVSNQMIVL